MFIVQFQMIKFIQSTQFINKDLHMYHAESNTPALARTSNLNEELGQVEMSPHLFPGVVFVAGKQRMITTLISDPKQYYLITTFFLRWSTYFPIKLEH